MPEDPSVAILNTLICHVVASEEGSPELAKQAAVQAITLSRFLCGTADQRKLTHVQDQLS